MPTITPVPTSELGKAKFQPVEIATVPKGCANISIAIDAMLKQRGIKQSVRNHVRACQACLNDIGRLSENMENYAFELFRKLFYAGARLDKAATLHKENAGVADGMQAIRFHLMRYMQGVVELMQISPVLEEEDDENFDQYNDGEGV